MRILLFTTVASILGAAMPAFAQPATAPSTAPATQFTKEQQVDQLFTYLLNEFTRRQLSSRDWITRSVATISIAQLPTPDATKALIERLNRETHAVARLVVWDAILARAGMLTDAQFALWQQATARMNRDKLFGGDLRIGLLQMLSSTPITPENRRLVQDLFNNTNSLDSTDLPTLVAMGRAIRAWGDAGLVESLIASMRNKDQSIRARVVLKAAGAPLEYSADPSAFEKWWKDDKTAFIKNKPVPGAWKSLAPHYIDPPALRPDVNPDDKAWREQLEVGTLGLRDFDFGITIDCSRSMTGSIERLKHDLIVMLTAFNEVAQQARIGVTGFATNGDVRTFVKLTSNKDELSNALRGLTVFGQPGDEEWAGAIESTIKTSDWRPVNERSRRVIVMITDEPMVPAQQVKATPIVKKAAADGFKLYTVLALPLNNPPDPFAAAPRRERLFDAGMTGSRLLTMLPPEARAAQNLKVYEDLSELAGGQVLISRIPDGALGLGTLPLVTGPRRAPVVVDANAIGPVYPYGGPTAHLLSVVLADAIHPQYSARVGPLVQILAAHSQHVAWVPEVRNR